VPKLSLARILEASKSRSQDAGMNKTIHSRQSEAVREKIVALRTKAGLTQRELAAKLGRERSLIARLEQGERRLDIVEFFWLCRACNADPVKESVTLMRQLDSPPTKSKTTT
jgi:ribosome-binding protein aMBF1 (putative translation factor)